MQFERRRCSQTVHILEARPSSCASQYSYQDYNSHTKESSTNSDSFNFVGAPLHSARNSSATIRVAPYTGYDWKQDELKSKALVRKNGLKISQKPAVSHQETQNKRPQPTIKQIREIETVKEHKKAYQPFCSWKQNAPTATQEQRKPVQTIPQAQKPNSPLSQKLLEQIRVLKDRLQRKQRSQKQLEAAIVSRDRKVSDLQRDKFIQAFRIQSLERENRSLQEQCAKLKSQKKEFEFVMRKIQSLQSKRLELEQQMQLEEQEWDLQKKELDQQAKQFRQILGVRNR